MLYFLKHCTNFIDKYTRNIHAVEKIVPHKCLKIMKKTQNTLFIFNNFPILTLVNIIIFYRYVVNTLKKQICKFRRNLLKIF